MKLYKKGEGQLDIIKTLVIVLIMVGVILAAFFLVAEEFEEQLSTETATVTQESLTTVDEIGEWLANNYSYTGCWSGLTVYNITNRTGDMVIATTNYTVSTLGLIQFTSTAAENINDTNWNVTYSYKYGEDACVAIEVTQDSIQELPDWLDIVALMIMIGIIMSLILKVFPRVTGGGITGGTAEV